MRFDQTKSSTWRDNVAESFHREASLDFYLRDFRLRTRSMTTVVTPVRGFADA